MDEYISPRDKVRYKTLWDSGQKILDEINKRFIQQSNLMFEFEDEATKREIYNARDCIRRFMDNLKLKPKYQKMLDNKIVKVESYKRRS